MYFVLCPVSSSHLVADKVKERGGPTVVVVRALKENTTRIMEGLYFILQM